jgi:hypothetical protein
MLTESSAVSEVQTIENLGVEKSFVIRKEDNNKRSHDDLNRPDSEIAKYLGVRLCARGKRYLVGLKKGKAD